MMVKRWYCRACCFSAWHLFRKFIRSVPSREAKWLFRQIRPFIRLHLLSLACIIIACLLALLDPLVMKWLIDDIIPNHRAQLLLVVAVVFLATYTGRLIFNRLSSMCTFLAISKMVFRVRLRLLRHLQGLSSEYHDNMAVGDTLHRIERDVDQVGSVGGELIPNFIRLVVTFAMTIGAMLVLNWRLTLIILPLIPAFMMTRHYYRARLRRLSDVVQESQGRISSFLQEHLSAITQVQLFARELAESRRFIRLSGYSLKSHYSLRRASQTFSIISLLIIALGIAIILAYGGYKVMMGVLTTGELVAFYSYLLRLFDPINNAVGITSKLGQGGASIRRILEVMDHTVSRKNTPYLKRVVLNNKAWVELQNVSFSYPAGRLALADISLRIDPGQRIALVGPSGSGKSTIAKLLTRLYEMQAGVALINGLDIRDIDLSDLRAAVALVTQEVVLFEGTLRENIAFGNGRASQQALEQAIGIAQLEEMISRLPQGLETPVGPRGNKFSGGEKQRIALARAVVRNPAILILDEPTAALDAATEQAFIRSLTQFAMSRTTIVISHRVSTIIWADSVVVLDEGRVVANGTHNQLCLGSEVYQGLCNQCFEL
jgi:ATP-binding cassette, subfamily B, bacterial